MDWRSVARGHSRIGRPSIKTESSGASHKRAMRAASVVLPLPVGPTIASVVPAGTFKLMSEHRVRTAAIGFGHTVRSGSGTSGRIREGEMAEIDFAARLGALRDFRVAIIDIRLGR